MAQFTEYLKEARKPFTIDTVKDGQKPGDMLIMFYEKYKDKTWLRKENKFITKKFGKRGNTFLNILIRDGYIFREELNFNITDEGKKYAEANSGDEKIELAKGVKDVSKLRKKRFKVPKVGKNSKYLDQMKTILSHMKAFGTKKTKISYMLAGEPGSGKTSFIRSLSTLTGIPLVVIEAPHITQEHLINIPFLVIDGRKERQGNVTIDDSEGKMKVVQAESNLVTQLKSKRKRTPEEIQREINKNKILRELQPKLKYGLDQIQGMFNSILFLDEFYRTSNKKITNVLRNILNGRIGNDKVPAGVYIITATNLDDEGIDDIQKNQQYQLMNYDVSSKDDFMNYMYSKYIGDEEDTASDSASDTDQEEIETTSGMQIEVWNSFMDEITDEDLGFTDEEKEVRLSPRRLEQMIIYINAALPVNTEKDAKNLFAFLKNNLSNYLSEESSETLLTKFNGILSNLIQETSPNINVEMIKDMPIKKSEWRDQLQHELEMKVKLGDDRKYIPVVSGDPGIGKTTQAMTIAKDLSMGFIQIDVSNLTPEDITGMPIANMGDEITTEFSEPNLYISIMKDYNEQIKKYFKEGRKYNIILLFDELNRATVPVFNAIRKVLLEKEFESVKLPEDVLMVGAINPHDEGTTEFTSHTTDVIDIIPSAGHFTKTMDYTRNKPDLKELSDEMGFEIHESICNIMSQLALEMKSGEDLEGDEIQDVDVQPFFWQAGSSVVYVSPREMTECIVNACTQCQDAFGYMGWDVEADYTDEDYDAFIEEALNVTAKSFVHTFEFIDIKHDVKGFSQQIGMKIQGNEKFKKLFESIRNKKSANLLSLTQILDNAEGDINFLDKGVIGEYVKDFSSTEMVHDVASIMDEYINRLPAFDALENIIKLNDRLIKSLGKLKVSFQYADQIKKYSGGKIVSILKSDNVNIVDVMKNDKLMKALDRLS